MFDVEFVQDDLAKALNARKGAELISVLPGVRGNSQMPGWTLVWKSAAPSLPAPATASPSAPQAQGAGTGHEHRQRSRK